ncbi:o-spanin [Sulfitobacter phage phiGT1]|nr:o-spanin [Sulfitobacter phage phiGT1]
MREPLKTKRGMLLTMICAASLLTGCGDRAGSAPAFKDIQRNPPTVKPETADYLLANDRNVGVWIVETAKKCAEFGCVK